MARQTETPPLPARGERFELADMLMPLPGDEFSADSGSKHE